MSINKSQSFLTFQLANELFAISVHKVLEIIETDEEHNITPLPKAPPTVSGVINFRGNVIPVIDTRMKFDMPFYQEGERFVVMVLNLQIGDTKHLVGCKTDKVVDVIEIDMDKVEDVPAIAKGYNSEYIDGVVNRNERFIMLLNLEEAIGSDDIVSLKKEDVELEEASEQTVENKE
ncbi:chemotaxis protein CheW [Carboxylicivirga marina]|uniref:Chemotaxis protein CheW n=1 Tax=Carboxylicivirga marina TaxID=2800988 RepID=A0ABS1HPR4_9BACT|nr:chemotaxis protein CheW [Carboxylicivirga marina]MBK3519677.1 chemotaxis protein CheW [Carboxylicivirga marina]